jgi:SAM-dependent methyltransferase
MMRQPDAVQSLFNDKAPTWSGKYDPNGPLFHRLQAFGGRLRALVAPPADVLDFGCGTGNLARYLSAEGYRLSACDIAENMIVRARLADRSNAVDWRALPPDWRTLPFSSAVFDAVVASSVFEYVSDVGIAFAECSRTLKPNGVLVLTVPDPNHVVRRIERLIRPVMTLLVAFRLSTLLSRLDAYATYLACSRNRLSMAKWSALAAEADFVTVGADRGTGPLMFLEFRKVPRTAAASPFFDETT